MHRNTVQEGPIRGLYTDQIADVPPYELGWCQTEMTTSSDTNRSQRKDASAKDRLSEKKAF